MATGGFTLPLGQGGRRGSVPSAGQGGWTPLRGFGLLGRMGSVPEGGPVVPPPPGDVLSAEFLGRGKPRRTALHDLAEQRQASINAQRTLRDLTERERVEAETNRGLRIRRQNDTLIDTLIAIILMENL